MPNQDISLTDQEKKIVQEVQASLGFKSIEETLEFLARQRIREMLAKLSGQEIQRNQRNTF